MDLSDKKISLSTWKNYLFIVSKFLLVFYLATIGMTVLFIYRGEHWILPGIFFSLLYVVIITLALKKMLRQLPMVAIMLAAPMVPLCMLILVLSLIPIVQILR